MPIRSTIIDKRRLAAALMLGGLLAHPATVLADKAEIIDGQILPQQASERAADQPGLAQLYRSASVALVENALKRGADVNQPDADGLTPLMLAAGSNSSVEVIKLLVGRGAAVNAQENKFGLTPLMFAATWNLPSVGALIELGAEVNQRDKNGCTAAYHAAANNKNPGVIFYLVNGGADMAIGDVDGVTPIMQAALMNNVQALMMLLDKKVDVNGVDAQGRTALSLLARAASGPDTLNILLKADPDLESRDQLGRTPLLNAAADNPSPIITETLLKAGADLEAVDDSGSDALLLASLGNNNPEIVQLLIHYGADVSGRRANGLTPLLAAAGNSKPEVARALIIAGADLTAKDPHGRNALLLAAWLNPNPEVAKTMANGGLDPLEEDDSGVSAVQYAREHRPELFSFLDQRAKDFSRSGGSGDK